MGRWAFFNTGMEYKFAFAIQGSEDITMFGGRRSGDLCWTWSAEKDLPIVKAALDYLHLLLGGQEPIDVEKYEMSVNGTCNLQHAILNSFDGTQSECILVHRYALGCLIFHQLLYQAELTVEYEP